MVVVTLLAYSQWNPKIRFGEQWKHPEHIMATGKRICQTADSFESIFLEKDKIESRVRSSVKDFHRGVLEHVTFTFLIEDISRIETHQHVRHRLASYLQMSQRTVDALELDFITPPSVMLQYLPEDLEDDIVALEALSRSVYDRLQKNKIPRGDARYYLLHGWETRIWMTVNGSALMHFLKERLLNKRAQWEIKSVGKQMYELVKEVAPNAFAEDLQGFWV